MDLNAVLNKIFWSLLLAFGAFLVDRVYLLRRVKRVLIEFLRAALFKQLVARQLAIHPYIFEFQQLFLVLSHLQ